MFHDAHWQHIEVVRCQRMFASTERVECADGQRLTFDSSRTADGSAADARGLLHENGHMRVLVDGTRIVGVGHPRPRMHVKTAGIMRAIGMDVDAVTAWALSPLVWTSHLDHRVELGVSGMGAVVVDDGHVVLMCCMEEHAIVHEDISIQVKLPEALVLASTGRLLRDVVSIPSLDHLELPILHAEVSPVGTLFRVIPEDGALPLDTNPQIQTEMRMSA